MQENKIKWKLRFNHWENVESFKLSVGSSYQNVQNVHKQEQTVNVQHNLKKYKHLIALQQKFLFIRCKIAQHSITMADSDIFRVKIDLKYFYTDHKSKAYVSINRQWKNVRQFHRHIADIFDVKKFVLLTSDGVYLPGMICNIYWKLL